MLGKNKKNFPETAGSRRHLDQKYSRHFTRENRFAFF
jgi:hypothetical protein